MKRTRPTKVQVDALLALAGAYRDLMNHYRARAGMNVYVGAEMELRAVRMTSGTIARLLWPAALPEEERSELLSRSLTEELSAATAELRALDDLVRRVRAEKED